MATIAPFAGFGLGLRRQHYAEFLDQQQPVDFVEIISENFMVPGGRPKHTLDAVRERYQVAMHGVSMSIGSTSGLDRNYLARLKALADHVRPLWVSDHLCWTGIAGRNTHDLLPVPYTHEALDIICANILMAQDILERPMLFENPSSYGTLGIPDMAEWDFLAAMTERTGCYLLLDVNNVFVNSRNHGLDTNAYLSGLPANRVRQIHLAGHSQGPELLIDTHDSPVCDDVWSLYEQACTLVGAVATMIERDDEIPPLADLLDELAIARCRKPINERRAA